jgi:hypothetical protein
MSDAGKKGLAKRWAGHIKQTKAEYNDYHREYQRAYYHRRKALQLAVDESDSVIEPVNNKI